MARKYYHAEGLCVVKDHHDGVVPVLKHICVCLSPEMAQKIAAKLNAADDYEQSLSLIADAEDGGGPALARIALKAVASKNPNHY